MRTIGIIALLLVAQAAWAYPDLTITDPNTVVGDMWYGASINNLTVAPGASMIGPVGGTSSVWTYGDVMIQGTVGAAGQGIALQNLGTGTVTFTGAGQWVDRGSAWNTSFRGTVILDNSVAGFNLSGRLPTIDELHLQNVTLIGSNEAATVETINNFVPSGSKITVQHGISQTAELVLNAGGSAYFSSPVSFNGLSDPSNKIRVSAWWGEDPRQDGQYSHGILRWGRVGMEFATLDSNGYVSAFSGTRPNTFTGALATDNILLDSTSSDQTLDGDLTVNSLKIDGATNINLGGKNLTTGIWLSSQIIKTGTGQSTISNGTLLAGGGGSPQFITNDSDLKITADINASRVVKTGTGKLTLAGNLIGGAQYVKWYEGDLVLDTNSDVNFYLYDYVTTTSGKLTKNGSGTLNLDTAGGWQNLSSDGMLIAGGRVVNYAAESVGNLGSGVVEFRNGAILEQLGCNSSPILMTSGTVVVPASWLPAYLTGQVTIKDMTKAGPNNLCLDGTTNVDGALNVKEGKVIVRGQMNVTAGPITGDITLNRGNINIQTGGGHAFGAGSRIVIPDNDVAANIVDNNANGDTTLGAMSIGYVNLSIQSNAGANTTIGDITVNSYQFYRPLVKTGPGALTLAGTIVNLQGECPYLVLNWTDGPLNLNYNTGNVMLNGDITNNQPLTMNGSGTVTFDRSRGRNLRTAGMVITGGQVVSNGGDSEGVLGSGLVDLRDGAKLFATGVLEAPIRLSNAGLVRYDSWANGTTPTVSIDVPAGKTGTIDMQTAPIESNLYNRLDLHTLTGAGTLEKVGPGAVQFSQGGSFTGTIHVKQGNLVMWYNWDTGGAQPSALPAGSKILLDAGATLLDGGWSKPVNFGKETIAGKGNIDMSGPYGAYATATFQGTTLMPGDTGAGVLSITRAGAAVFAADPTSGSLAKLKIDILGAGNVAGTDYDQLAVDGQVMGLDQADLIVNIANGLNLKGQVLTVITTTSDLSGLLVHSATFGTKYTGTVTGVLGGLILSDIKLAAIPGDANHSGLVDQDDYKIWYDNYGTGTTWEQGNFKGSGVTDQDDYKTWYDNYGVGTAGGAVPEPATMALLALGGLAMLRRKK